MNSPLILRRPFDPVRQRKRFVWLDELSALLFRQVQGRWLHYLALLRRRLEFVSTQVSLYELPVVTLSVCAWECIASGIWGL